MDSIAEWKLRNEKEQEAKELIQVREAGTSHSQRLKLPKQHINKGMGQKVNLSANAGKSARQLLEAATGDLKSTIVMSSSGGGSFSVPEHTSSTAKPISDRVSFAETVEITEESSDDEN